MSEDISESEATFDYTFSPRCNWCGGEMTWCELCQVWSHTCCCDYGTCQCS